MTTIKYYIWSDASGKVSSMSSPHGTNGIGLSKRISSPSVDQVMRAKFCDSRIILGIFLYSWPIETLPKGIKCPTSTSQVVIALTLMYFLESTSARLRLRHTKRRPMSFWGSTFLGVCHHRRHIAPLWLEFYKYLGKILFLRYWWIGDPVWKRVQHSLFPHNQHYEC